MRILGIETSCDETGAAVIEDGTKLFTNVTATSSDLHRKTGGIVPEVAAREQIRCIISVIDEALGKRGEGIDAIAVTVGPGLIGSLLVGVETARTLSLLWQKPLVSINHLVGHIYANWLEKPPEDWPKFPAICLIVSGGHTELILMEDHKKMMWLGGTRDDAAGEAFDKVARLLGLGYPGGPEIQKAAEGGNPQAVSLPRPMINTPDFDFSFSGLKTAVVNKLKLEVGRWAVEDVAASFQKAVADVLVTKTIKAAQKYRVKSVLLAGGVAANTCLREKFRICAGNSFNIFIPPVSVCTDNAAPIASAAFFNYKVVSWKETKVAPGLSLRS